MTQQRGGPLQGIRVIELTKVWAGPYAGKLLSFLGAEVIRIESEGSLDVTRIYGVDDLNKAPGFMAVNPQKLSAQINMKSEQGIALLLDLLAKSDILLENLRPGAIERLGLGYERVKNVNPGIIFTSMGMYGAAGPLAYQTGYAPCFAALSGLSSVVGYEGEAPGGMNVRYADSTFGTAAALASVAALRHRNRTGEGQFIDVSAVETMTSMMGDAIMKSTLNDEIQACDGNRHAEMAPHGVYPCQNSEWLALAAKDDDAWAVIANTIAASVGKPELATDPRFATLAARKQHEAELDSLISHWSTCQDASEAAAELQHAGIAASKSFTSLDLISDQHLWARSFYPEVSTSDGNSRAIVGPGWKMSRAAQIHAGAPRLGEHNHYVFGEILGLSEGEQAKLAEAGVTR
ncbi:CaiB/BaiF CoA transferase family protein [Litorivivens sp.]|uniref:CaiB/BaiF CoA transferase family protein n=1 Tax=Litorivivens sp. TaxID=2020868 RepID=UPI0035625C3D